MGQGLAWEQLSDGMSNTSLAKPHGVRKFIIAIDHMQISAPFCFGCGRHIEKSFAKSEPHSIQLLLHCCVSEFWSHCKVLQELADSRLSFLRRMVESIDSHGAEQEEVGFHRNFRWVSLGLVQAEVTQQRGNAGRAAGAGSMRNGAI